MVDTRQTRAVVPVSGPPSVKSLNALTSMRFFAALTVFGAHVGLANVYTDHRVTVWLGDFFNPLGRYSVTFFFALSGFVLTWAARPGQFRAFYRGRVAKIMPLHIVTWAITLTLIAVVLGRTTPLRTALMNMFLLHAWSLDPPTLMVSVNAPSYTLCSEALFYLCFPLIVMLVVRMRSRWLWPSVVASAIGAYLMGVVATYLLPSTPALPGYGVSLVQSWFTKIFPPAHLFEFVIGVFVARIVMTRRWPRISVRMALAITVVALVVEAKVPLLYTFGSVAALPAALLIGALAAAENDGRSTLGLDRRLLVRLGELSFAFYMIHWIVLTFGRQLIGAGVRWNTATATGLAMLALLLSVVLAWLLHVGVERPIMRHWSRRRRPSTALKAVWSEPRTELPKTAGTP